MNDSGKNRVKANRAQLVSFLKQANCKRLSLDIKGLTHEQCAAVMFGHGLLRLAVFFRFIVFQSICMWPFHRFKNFIYRRFGMRVGKNVYISPGVYMDPVHPQLIRIDDNVIVGVGAGIVSHERTMDRMIFGRVHIEKNCCIGGQSIIRCGVTLGQNSIVDMQQNVKRDVPSCSYVQSAQTKIMPISDAPVSDGYLKRE